MTSFSKSYSCFHSLEIAHFSDDDHIWIFTKNRLDSMPKAFEVFSEFSLMYEGKLILIDELYRIFEGDDMPTHGAVDIVEHRRHSRRFTTSGWSCNQNNSLFSIRYFEKIFWEHDRFSGWYDRRNRTKGNTRSTNDMRYIDTKTSSMIFE